MITPCSEFDVYFEGKDFKFYAKPYFLRQLTLPGRIVEDGREKASYNVDKDIFTVRLPKETPGQYFDVLDMLTALLAQKKSRSTKPLVEEIGTSAELAEEERKRKNLTGKLNRSPYHETAESTLHLQCCYGFGNLKSGVFQRLQDELSDVIDVKDPDLTPADGRRQKRLETEAAKFDPDHYLADFFEDVVIQHVLKYKPWWVDAYAKKMASQGRSHQEHVSQTTFGKKSSWNIRKLSATLCWLESFTSIPEVLVSFGRRVLCYPLYRHFRLVTRAFSDTVMILQLGKSAVLKCLLDIHKIFRENDPAYILNDLYITDYCIWIQKTKSKKLAALAESLQKAKLTKAHLGFELEELESAALLVQEEESELKAVSAVSKQQLPSSELETSDSEESSSTLSSETESSDSDEQESSASEDGKINSLQGALQEERTAPLIDCNGLGQDTGTLTLDVSNEKSKASLQSTSVPGKLIEELGKKMQTAIRLSEQPEELATASYTVLQEKGANYAVEPQRLSEDPSGKENFLEVSPKRNLLLFVGSTNEDED
uniref:Protein SHQ1 homolog n=1 Tax=Gopherus evgoodei TaxID=1825980 RepID=A0A8C4YJP9_9SAUR